MNLGNLKSKGLIIFISMVLIFIVYRVSSNSESVIEINSDISDDISIKTTTNIEGNDIIKVYICGEITNEGVYEMSSGDRLTDLIDKAGGFTEDAYTENLNLAMKIKDGEKIKIYSIDENIGEENNDGYLNYSGVEKINHMTLEELKQIPGIGDKIGEDILNYINDNGPIYEYDQLLDVEGIGDSKLENIIDFINE
jgi:competence protein ComEA